MGAGEGSGKYRARPMGCRGNRLSAQYHRDQTRLFGGTGLARGDFYRAYDVHPDGKRFLMVNAGGADSKSLEMIVNWRMELDRLLGASR